MKRTRIIATIGPASCKPATLLKLIQSGVNVARLNFSHGSYEDHASYIAAIRLAARRARRTVTILQDLSGPKVRVGDLPPEGVALRAGEKIIFSNNPKRASAIPFQYLGLPRDVSRGDTILLDDGLLEAEVIATTPHELTARVIVGGTLLSHKGINVPSARLKVAAITEKDKRDLEFGLAHGVDWVALSFVRDPRDVEQLRKLISSARPTHVPKIIVKIEKHEAVDQLEAIIHATDGVMIARGDLGVEMPPEQVPLIQKRIIALCRGAHKPVVVATQMLDSMIRNPRPTRAEVSDVAQAVFDGTDAVMLSGESASGKYPVEAVQMMARIIGAAEQPGQVLQTVLCHPTAPASAADETIGQLSVLATDLHDAAAILVPQECASLVPFISHVRAHAMIIMQARSDREAAQMNVCYGVYPLRVRSLTRSSAVRALLRAAVHDGLLERRDRVVVLTSSKKEPFFSLEEIAA